MLLRITDFEFVTLIRRDFAMDLKTHIAVAACLALMLASHGMQAQDRIYFNDRPPVEAVVKEIGDTYVLYRLWETPAGPDYRTSLTNVDSIVFRDGTRRIFAGSPYAVDEFAEYGAVMPGCITYRRGRFYSGPYAMSTAQLMDRIGYANYGSIYRNAKNMYVTGQYLTYSGAGFLFAAIMIHIASACYGGPGNEDAMIYGICYGLGAAELAVGIPLLVTGNRRLGALADDYNRRNGYGHKPGGRPVELALGVCRSGGAGISLNF